MTKYSESNLYGKLPLIAVSDFMKQIPKDFNITKTWVHVFEALKQYYQGEMEIDQDVIKKLVQSYKDQHHSGCSHGVATQAIMQYLGGVFDNEDKEFVRNNTKS